MYVEWLIW